MESKTYTFGELGKARQTLEALPFVGPSPLLMEANKIMARAREDVWRLWLEHTLTHPLKLPNR